MQVPLSCSSPSQHISRDSASQFARHSVGLTRYWSFQSRLYTLWSQQYPLDTPVILHHGHLLLLVSSTQWIQLRPVIKGQ